MEFNKIIEHRWEGGTLIFDVQLQSGRDVELLLHLLKKDSHLKWQNISQEKLSNQREVAIIDLAFKPSCQEK